MTDEYIRRRGRGEGQGRVGWVKRLDRGCYARFDRDSHSSLKLLSRLGDGCAPLKRFVPGTFVSFGTLIGT